MASSSRGLLSFTISSLSPRSSICAQCLRRAQHLRTISQPHQWRPFSIARSIQQQAKAKTGKLRLRDTNPSTSSQSSPPAQAYEGLGDYAQKLNMTLTVPTVIYEAPSHRTLIIAACGISLFFVGYGVLNAWKPGLGFIFGSTAPQDQIAGIIPPALIFVGFALTGIGIWSYGAVRMLVKRITVIPQGSSGPLQARVEVTKFAPWRRHEITATIKDLSLGRRVQDIAPEHSLTDRYRDISKAGMLIRPFMSSGRWVRNFFDETRNVFWRVPFVTLNVDGHGRYTLDARGTAYKGSVGLDRLIPVDLRKGKFWEQLG